MGKAFPIVNSKKAISWTTGRVDINDNKNVVHTTFWAATPPANAVGGYAPYSEFPSGAGHSDGDVAFFSRLVVRKQDSVVGAFIAAFDGPLATPPPDLFAPLLAYLGSIFVPLSDGGDLSPPTFLHVAVRDGIITITDSQRARVVMATDPAAMEMIHAFDIEYGKFAMGTESILLGRTLVPFIPDSGIVGGPVALDDPDDHLLGNR